jgi:hypothetical protein
MSSPVTRGDGRNELHGGYHHNRIPYRADVADDRLGIVCIAGVPTAVAREDQKWQEAR